MISTLLAAGLLLIPSANAFWRMPCTKSVLNARVDPIVSPGGPSPHAHTIMGGNAIGFDTTYEDARASNCTTCMVKDDLSMYWIPTMHYQFENKSYAVVTHGGMTVYYLQRNDPSETVEAFPNGLRMVAGDPYRRAQLNTSVGLNAISWLCLNFNGSGTPQTPGFNNTVCPDGLRAQVFFPACWDGIHLDSSNHSSHMAYPDGVDNGKCPPTHPHHLISIFYEVLFSVDPFNQLHDDGKFVLANGDPTGYGLHGDFLNGWNSSDTVLARAIEKCTDGSGVIEQCSVFKDEGRLLSSDETNNCFAQNPDPIPSEEFDQGNILPYLPGCVAVSKGPDPAKPGALAPGCVIDANGNGNAAAPSSGAPSDSATPPASSSVSAPPSSSTPDAVPSGTSSMPSSPSDSAASSVSSRVSVFDGDTSALHFPLPTTSSIVTSSVPAQQLVASAASTDSGMSSVPTSADPAATNTGSGSGSCPRNYPRDSTDSHRRSRTARRHGSPLSN